MNKKNKFNSHSEINLDSMSEIIKTLTSFMRIDIKNLGTENNSTLITADNAKIATPTWFSDDTGQGKVFSSSSMTIATCDFPKIRSSNVDVYCFQSQIVVSKRTE